MFFGQNRQQLRQFFVSAWQKRRDLQPLQPLEALVADVVERHPEYHTLLQSSDHDSVTQQDYPPESGEGNPFMHLGMHVALHEQLASDRPPGVKDVYQRLCQHYGEPHQAEHQMLEALGETLWEAGRDGRPPDEQRYLERLRRLA